MKKLLGISCALVLVLTCAGATTAAISPSDSNPKMNVSEGDHTVPSTNDRIVKTHSEGSLAANHTELEGIPERPVHDRSPRNTLDEYVWSETTYDWIDITGVGTSCGIVGDDQNRGPFDIGFSFQFYGNTYSTIRVCSNGWASFTSTSFSCDNASIPSATTPNNALYPFWDDLFPLSGGYQILYYFDAVNQRFVLSWINLAHIDNSAARYSFQIVLSPSGEIGFNYSLVSTNAPTNTSCTVGIENSTGTEAVQVCNNGVGWLPTTGTSIRIYNPYGELSGQVREYATMNPLQGAAVTVEEVPGAVAYTNAAGFYSLTLLAGTYTMWVHKQGYCDEGFTGLPVFANGTTVRNVVLYGPVYAPSTTSIYLETDPGVDISTEFTLSNPGGNCPLEYELFSEAPWLTFDPTEGQVAPNRLQTIAVIANVGGLSSGLHLASLLVNHNGTGSPRVIDVALDISEICNTPNPAVVDVSGGIPICQCVDACENETLTLCFAPLSERERPVEVLFQEGCTGDECSGHDCPPANPTPVGDYFYNAELGGWCVEVEVVQDGCFCVCIEGVLPIELLSFSVIPAEDGIRISFSTASETDNDRFEILRGDLAEGEFARIAALPSQGNSATEQRYEYTDVDVNPGQTYWYYLADVDMSGHRTEHRNMTVSATALDPIAAPSSYSLSVYPNPFNPSTTISFTLPEAGMTRVAVYDVSGRWVQTLADETRSAGSHTIAFDARELPSGVYFVRMASGEFQATRKIVLMR